jgi:hypothetical protein
MVVARAAFASGFNADEKLLTFYFRSVHAVMELLTRARQFVGIDPK